MKVNCNNNIIQLSGMEAYPKTVLETKIYHTKNRISSKLKAILNNYIAINSLA